MKARGFHPMAWATWPCRRAMTQRVAPQVGHGQPVMAWKAHRGAGSPVASHAPA